MKSLKIGAKASRPSADILLRYFYHLRMAATKNPRNFLSYKQLLISSIEALITYTILILSGGSLLCWIFRPDFLDSYQEIAMSPESAVSFLGLGMAFWMRKKVPSGPGRLALAAAAALAISIGGFGSGAAFVFFDSHPWVADPDFSQLFVQSISPISGIGLLLMGLLYLSLLLHDRHRTRDAAGIIAALIIGTAFIVVIGYLYGEPLLYGGRIRPIGILSAILFMLSGIHLLFQLGPEAFPARYFYGDSVRSQLLRSLLPITFFSVFFGELAADIVRLKPFWNPVLQNALLTLVLSVIVTVSIFQVARSLGLRLDLEKVKRLKAENELSDALGLMENKIRERTADLSASEARSRTLLTAIPDLILRLNSSGTILDCKPASNSGYFAPIKAGESIETAFSATVGEELQMTQLETLRTQQCQVLEFRWFHQQFWHEYECRFIPFGENETLAIIRDISESRRLEREILAISTREQIRIGQDLHDNFGQTFAGISCLSKVLEDALARKGLAEAEQIATIRQLFSKAAAQARILSRNLLATEMRGAELLAALNHLTAEAARTYGIFCELDADSCTLDDPAAGNHLFRIAQESITNAVKHGKATHINILLDQNKDRLSLIITDNGSGFSHHPFQEAREGLGLRIMQFRARSIGAYLTIQSEVGRGTSISCLLWLDSKNRNKPLGNEKENLHCG